MLITLTHQRNLFKVLFRPRTIHFFTKFEFYLVTRSAYFGAIFTFGLLGFLLLAPDILHHWNICLNSAPLVLPLVNLQV
jgi:hypothetical protein